MNIGSLRSAINEKRRLYLNNPEASALPRRRTRVKFCGINTVASARQAADSGADAIGLMFYEPSCRAVSPAQAMEIVAALPPLVSLIGVFVDSSPAEMEKVLQHLTFSAIQFHGAESPEQCRAVGLPYIKAIPMQADTNLVKMAEIYHDAKALLLDNPQGGSGQCFDWSWVPSTFPLPLFIAGGLRVENVHQAITTLHPYAVDVSSGIETSRGQKCPTLMQQFMQEVYRV